MNLQTRVEKLERATGEGSGCPECGYIEGESITFTTTVLEPGDAPPPSLPDEHCATCGRVTRFTFTIKPGGKDESDDAERVS